MDPIECNIQLCFFGKRIFPHGIYMVSPYGTDVRIRRENTDFVLTDDGTKHDTSQYTVFRVTFTKYTLEELEKGDILNELIDLCLESINEFGLRAKNCEQVQSLETARIRQVGRIDLEKLFVHCDAFYRSAGFNYFKSLGDKTVNFISSFSFEFLNSNGPNANPLSPFTKRVMSIYDLANLGFHTEAFIVYFSLFDDTLQETLKYGLEMKGLTAKEQKKMLLAIKDNRISHFLHELPLLLDRESLKVTNQELFKKIRHINSVRNKIMHGNTRIKRKEYEGYQHSLYKAIRFLRTNPFGYKFGPYPNTRII